MSRPLTAPEMRRLATLAYTVALQAPEDPKRSTTYIPRATVEEIRKACEEIGIDWRRAHRKHQSRIALGDARRVKTHSYLGERQKAQMIVAYVKKARRLSRRAWRQKLQGGAGTAQRAGEARGA